MGLMDLLTQLSNERVNKAPEMDPVVMEIPQPQSPIADSRPVGGRGMESLLPLLMQGGGSINQGIQGNRPSGGSSNWENVAQRIAQNKYGYSPQQFNMLDSIIERESHWNPNALNKESGAWGIPQILPLPGRPERGELGPREQINWLLKYIEGRYGGVENALAYKNREGTY